ncbi:uncharacterized protein LOC129005500 isoform X1 [Macrosteles quadrilineatus]|uniref:uncharacterized protein LOC129005500 isoform X1 n=2 Tax=Macrosteles quadrilineatus TaxID=74068 RepID=UPI0023E2FC32|nr:uncharacterized protein LOC129005500 isoform X1 [Macrosteles quadrilineatus]
MCANLLLHLAIVIALCIYCEIEGVQITGLFVPHEVQNGSDHVLLDCEYSLRPEELQPTSGLVVKWFYNNSPAPVYQWIPGNKPQDLGVLKGRLNLEHRASQHNGTAHRALYILQPTTDLSGEYKCAVSTFHEEDFMIKRMLVYAPERKIEVFQTKTDLQGVNVSCRALGVFPEPKMVLYKGNDIKKMTLMTSASLESVSHDGVYDVTITGFLHDEELNSPVIVDCELSIPETSYTRRKLMHYYPGRALAWIADDTSGAVLLRVNYSGIAMLFVLLNCCLKS